MLTNILVHYIGRQFKCDLHLFIILWKVKWTNATYIIYLHIRPFHLLTFYFPIWREFFFEYIYIHAYILMQILFTHALNCLGMVVALMSHDNLQSWPWPKRFQRDQQPPPPGLIWSTDKHFLDTMWINERFLGVVMWVGSPAPPTKHLIQRAPKVLVGLYSESS